MSGSWLNVAASISMPVESSRPVLGHLTITTAARSISTLTHTTQLSRFVVGRPRVQELNWLEPAQQRQDDDDDEDETNNTRRAVSPSSAVAPCRNDTEQDKNEDDDKDCA